MPAKILWAIIAGFLIGVFLRSTFPIPLPYLVTILCFSLLCITAGFFIKRYEYRYFLAAVLSTAIVGGMLRVDAAIRGNDPIISQFVDQNISAHGIVVREPDVRERNVRLTVDITELLDRSQSIQSVMRVLVIAPAHTEIAYGDSIQITGRLEQPKEFETGEGRKFNYPMFLAKDGIQYELAFAQVEVIGRGDGNIFQRTAIWLKSSYLNGLRAVLPEPYAGLAGGITVGDKRSVGPDLTMVFQQISLVHILVLSGYNITVVLNWLARVFTWVPHRVRLLFTGGVITLFILMTGGAASATRAGAMAFLGVYARQSGRLFFAVRVLAVVACAMILWNPYILLFDPGFQLSVLATLGLVLFTPIFARSLTWVTEWVGLREIAASTLATQVMVLPLLLYQNGLLSIVALPANMLALIAVPAAMGMSVVAAIAGIILGSWGTLVALPAYVLLAYIIKVAELFAALPFAAISLPAFSAWWLAGMYGMIFFSYWFVQKKKTAELGSAVG